MNKSIIKSCRVKLILLFLFALFIVSSAKAQTTTLNVYEKGVLSHSIPITDIQKLTFSDLTHISNSRITKIINTFILFQNYPNPFNPSTIIKYQIPSSGRVSIQIFDISGRLIRSINQEMKNAGTYQVVWEGKNNESQTVASGVYFYMVKFNNSIMTKKMLFIK